MLLLLYHVIHLQQNKYFFNSSRDKASFLFNHVLQSRAMRGDRLVLLQCQRNVARAIVTNGVDSQNQRGDHVVVLQKIIYIQLITIYRHLNTI